MICSLCKQDKADDEFSWRKKGEKRLNHCKDCSRRMNREHYASHKPYYLDRNKRNKLERKKYIFVYLKSHPCVDCGETDPIVLQFDHVRGKKKYDVTAMVSMGFSVEHIESEMEKCDIRCANCHCRRHAKEDGDLRYIMSL